MIAEDMSLAEMQIEVRSLMAKKGVSRNPLIGVINAVFTLIIKSYYILYYSFVYNYVEFKKEVIAESIHELNKYMHMKISYRTKRKSDRYLISFNVE